MRKAYIDFLRIISIIFVVFNHTGPFGYTLFTTKIDSPFYYLYMAFSILCKVAVPIFFMISGALLLKKEESVFEVFKKRIFRIVLVLFIVSIPYYIWLNPSENFGVFDFFKTIYQTNVTTSFWYLYSYIGVLLMLPLLQKLAKAMSNNEFLYLICSYILLTGVFPALELVFANGDITLNPSFSAALFTSSNIVYVLTGYFLENRLTGDCYTKKNMLIMSAVSVISIALTCLLTQLNVFEVGFSVHNEVEKYFNNFIIVPAFSIFFIVKGISLKINVSNKVGKIITTLGASVFGTYLIEKIIRAMTSFVYTALNPYIGSFFASIVWVLVVVAVCLLIITGLKKVPYISKVVNLFI